MAGDFSNALTQWLHDQAVRMRRTKWSDPNVLADELFLILSRAPDNTTGPITATPSDNSFPPIEIPPVEDLNIPPLDLGFLDIPESNPQQTTTESPNQPEGGRSLVNIQTTFKRETVPGTIVSGSGDSYSVQIYPQGLGSDYFSQTLGSRNANVIQAKKIVTVRQPESVAGAVIPVGTWVLVWRFVEVAIIETIQLNSTGGIISKNTNVVESATEHLMFHPVWLAPTT